jgi:hypothetical protein
LLVSNGVPAPVFTLAGATSPACNGVYSLIGQYEGKNQYKLNTGNYWLYYTGDENAWVVTNEDSFGGTMYFKRVNASEFGAYTNNSGTGNVTFVQS